MTAVSAVVVNHNGGQQILRCVRDLLNLESRLRELVVVDNGSTDGSREAIRSRFPSIDLVEMGHNVGPAIARNVGLRHVSSPLVLLVDDDVYLTRECLQLMLNCQRREGAAAVAARLVLLPESDLVQADGGDVHFTGSMTLRNSRVPVDRVPAVASPIGAFSTSCVLTDRASLLEVGGFDESFFIYQEDTEISLRLRAFGHRLFCEPSAVAYHERGTGTPGLSYRDSGKYPKRRAYLTMRNRLSVVLLHYRFRTLLVLAPPLVVYEFASLVLCIRKGWIREWLGAWYWQISRLPAVIRRRRWIQRQRRVEDAQLLVGGSIPLAHGFLKNLSAQAVSALSSLLDFYWLICRPLVPGGLVLRQHRGPRTGMEAATGHTDADAGQEQRTNPSSQ